MPVENELKYVVKKSLYTDLLERRLSYYEITQSYLCMEPTVRIRKKITKGPITEILPSSGEPKHWLTLKTNHNDKTIEIEKEISELEYKEVLPKAISKVVKYRFPLKFDDEHWDIDFLLDKQGLIYFAMAEVEMPEDRIAPNFIPKIVIDNTIYVVNRAWNGDFSNLKLSNINYAEGLYRSLEKLGD